METSFNKREGECSLFLRRGRTNASSLSGSSNSMELGFARVPLPTPKPRPLSVPPLSLSSRLVSVSFAHKH